jgi:hypothetical protein
MLVVAVSAPSAFAQTPVNVNFDNAPSGTHFRQANVAPECELTITGTLISADCTGTTLGGVGNTNADLQVDLAATANFVCRNPGNMNIVEPHSDSVTDDDDQTLRATRNGQLTVPVTEVSVSAADAAEQFSCPNRRWTEQFAGFTNVRFTYSLTFAGFDAPVFSLALP